MKVHCLNCGHTFTIEFVSEDELGTFTVCSHCESSFDVDIKGAINVIKVVKNTDLKNNPTLEKE